ncbi:hypothetical protein [Pseudomonas azerbaijanoccidentalis]
MFKTAGVRFVRSVFYSISIASLAGLLGACTHSSPPDPGRPQSWVVENVASKTTQELYADWIAPAVYKRSGSKVIGDYTVESGNLIGPDKSIGSLVTVRHANGSLTAMIEEKGKSGLLTINSKGQGDFTPSPTLDFSRPDTVNIGAVTPTDQPESVTEEPYTVDVFIGYSRTAVDAVGGDVIADALAKVESVNLGLRNSLVTNVSLKLVGVQVIDRNYPMTGETLRDLPTIFSKGIETSQPDLIQGVFSNHPDDTSGGWGEYRGRKAVSHAIGEAFRHEVGHNAGGAHCYADGGAISTYAYGYNNGKTTTIQCGNESPFYSNPLVKDANDLPLGNVLTANMARVWRNNTVRLSSYAPTVIPQAPQNFRATPYSSTAVTFAWDLEPRAVRYQIWRGIVLVEDTESTEITTTNVTAGLQRYYVVAVYFDGTKSPPSNLVWTKPK